MESTDLKDQRGLQGLRDVRAQREPLLHKRFWPVWWF